MAPRASWKGYLKLSLVSCPVALYPAASSAERISFNRVNKKTGNKLKQQLVDAETGELVEADDVGRGFEIAKGQYLLIDDTDIEAIQLDSTHTIEITSFAARAEVDDRYLDSPYYIVPADQVGQEAFAAIRDAIRAKRVVGLGRVVLARRERVLMLEARDKGLLATALRYGYEVRDQASYFDEIPELKLPPATARLAGQVIDALVGPFDPKTFEDRYENALVELVRRKQAGHALEPVKDRTPAPHRVVGLMDALQASIDSVQKKPPAPSVKGRAETKKKGKA